MGTLWCSYSLPWGVATRLFLNYFGISCWPTATCSIDWPKLDYVTLITIRMTRIRPVAARLVANCYIPFTYFLILSVRVHYKCGRRTYSPTAKRPALCTVGGVLSNAASPGADLGFNKGGCPIHEKGAPEVERRRRRWGWVWNFGISYIKMVSFYRAMLYSAKRGLAIACHRSVCPSVRL